VNTNCNTCITIPTKGIGYNYDVDWNNDGIYDEPGITGDVTHDFGAVNTYTIRIKGDFPRIFSYELDTPQKLIGISQWGSGKHWETMDSAFYGCKNLTVSTLDTPDRVLLD